MIKTFDPIDIFFILFISVYFITLFLFLIILLTKTINKDSQIKKVIKKHNLISNKHYKHNLSYLKNIN